MKKNRSNIIKTIEKISSIAEAYISSPDDFVRTFTVQINGKKRHIITYKADEKGRALRRLHYNIAELIPLCYESMLNSFAYKKGMDILKCLEQHLESNTFLKTDIHEYFNSIQYEKLLGILFKDSVCKRNKSIVQLALKSCFYNGHMPIGFITSPVLSDLYLHKVDQQFLSNESIIYTRYADDFIISGKDNLNDLQAVKTQLADLLSDYGLSLNKKKTYYRILEQPGDAIHVLGLNLVHNDMEPNRITVSDRYIRDTSKDICGYLYNYKDMIPEEKEAELACLNGRIEFIRHSSPSSYRKLGKMVNIKYGKRIDLINLAGLE